MRILVTGADGFIGSVLCPALEAAGHTVRRAVRRPPTHAPPASTGTSTPVDAVVVGDIGPTTEWSAALVDVDVIVHLAARVHVLRESAADPLAAFRTVNVEGTERLARMAASSGVRRLVFVSTIGVNGQRTTVRPFTEQDEPAPQDAYARSKAEAEAALWRVAAETGLEVVMVRPPLVYGPGAKGNIVRMLQWIERGVPLPFARVENRRSLVYAGNLAALLECCISHPAAAGEVFLVSDGQALSTAALVRRLADGLGRRARLVPVPLTVLRGLGRLGDAIDPLVPSPIGSRDIDRLVDSLVIDARKATALLGFAPPFDVDTGLRATIEWYRHRKVTS